MNIMVVREVHDMNEVELITISSEFTLTVVREVQLENAWGSIFFTFSESVIFVREVQSLNI